MDNKHEDGRPAGFTRRGVLPILAAIPALGALAAVFLSRKKLPSTGPVVGSGTGALRASSAARELMKAYPQPRYLPDGYWLSRVATAPKVGLKRGKDAAELALIASLSSNPRHPLHVFVVPTGGDPTMFGTTKQPGEPVTLRASDGSTMSGMYHDGWWAPVHGKLAWDKRFFHSVQIVRNGFVVGVRGSRDAGIDREELFKVATSVT